MTIKTNQIKLDKWNIIKEYSISERNYHAKLKNGLKTLPPSKLLNKGKDRYYIDKSIIPHLFGKKRLPNKNNNLGIKKYVLSPSTKFQFKGCIKPQALNGKECEDLIKIVFDEMKRDLYPNNLTLFYFIEDNNKQKEKEYSETLSHIHYLIQTSDVLDDKPVLQEQKENDFIQSVKSILTTYKTDAHPFLEVYDDKRWGIEGKKYCVKDLTKYSLCGYFNYKQPNK